MVQVETSQLNAECNAWRTALRQYRDEFSRDSIKLQETSSKPLSRQQLQEVEHLHNQFHIQLINIHDLKQGIKAHQRKIEMEMTALDGSVKDETLVQHENLFDEYRGLDLTLQDLREEFDRYLKKAG